MASDLAAKQILGFAKNRLHKFYNPALYKPAPGGAVAPGPPPETAAAFSKKSEESNGVIASIDLMIKDLDKEMTQAKATEKNAQADYETTMKDSAEKRAE